MSIPGTLIVAAVSSLFLELEITAAGAKLRPFDALVFTMLLHLLFVRTACIKLPLGLVLAGLFFLVHAAGAAVLGPGNLLREGLQVCVVLGFGLYVYNMVDAALIRRCLPILTVLILTIMAYNIAWHIAQGYWTGWKRLDAPKLAFIFGTMLLTYYALRHHTKSAPGTLAAALMLPFMLPILLLSGERKALIFLFLCGLLYVIKTKPYMRPIGWLATLSTLVISLPMIPTLLEIPYVSQQVESLLSPFSTAQLTIDSTSNYFSDSLSNAQRVFATEVGLEMFELNPILGVGTNSYQQLVQDRFWHLPPVMLNSIHSEFLRVLVENGTVGLIIFSLPLIRAAYFLLATRSESVEWSGVALFFVGATILLSMESSGTKLMVPYVALALIPDISRRVSRRSHTLHGGPTRGRSGTRHAEQVGEAT